MSEADPAEPEAARYIVDITADQFGLPEVIVTREGDPLYRENLCPTMVMEELGHPTITNTERWFEEWIDLEMGNSMQNAESSSDRTLLQTV